MLVASKDASDHNYLRLGHEILRPCGRRRSNSLRNGRQIINILKWWGRKKTILDNLKSTQSFKSHATIWLIVMTCYKGQATWRFGSMILKLKFVDKNCCHIWKFMKLQRTWELGEPEGMLQFFYWFYNFISQMNNISPREYDFLNFMHSWIA